MIRRFQRLSEACGFWPAVGFVINEFCCHIVGHDWRQFDYGLRAFWVCQRCEENSEAKPEGR